MSVIGELLLRIGVDPSSWSQLQSTLDDGKQSVSSFGDAVTSTGQAMDSSFSSSVAGVTSSMSALASATDPVKDAQDALRQAFADSGVSMDTLQSSSDALAQALQEMGVDADSVRDPIAGAGDAASGAAGGMGDLGDAAGSAAPNVRDVGSSAEEAEGGLASMAAQLTAIGEALVITEGLKEFGQEALTAAGTVQSVTVGLTALTGSAEKADTIIESIKNLAATEPFAFPEIAPTVQKMVAMGVAAESIPGVLQTVADTASATTNSFEAVAQKFDAVTLSGNATAKSLLTFGLTLPQLEAAMGELGGATDLTGKAISAAFKELPDQAARVEVLQAALSKFAGTASAEAQTIGGQWRIFQNQFEEVMVSVGNALAPTVGEILAFGKAVLSGVQSAVDDFNKLPGPVKDVVVAIGLLAGAAVPLTGVLAAAGLAISGLGNLADASAGLMVKLGLAEGEEATAAAANATAHVTASGTVAASQAVLTGAITTTTGAIEAEAVQMDLFATEAEAAQLTLFDLNSTFGALQIGATEGAAAVGTLSGAARLGGIAFVALGAVVEGLALLKVAGDVTELARTLGELATSTKTAGVAAEGTGKSTGVMSDAWTNFKGELSSTPWSVWVTGMAGFDKAIQGATSDVQILANEWPGMTSAITQNLTALENANLKLTQTTAGLAGAYEPVSAGIQKVADEVAKQNAAVQAATAVYNTLKTALTDTNGEMKTSAVLSDGTIITTQTLAAAHKTLATAISAATDATKTHTAAANADKDSYAAVNAEASKLIATNIEAQTTYNKLADAQDGSETKSPGASNRL